MPSNVGPGTEPRQPIGLGDLRRYFEDLIESVERRVHRLEADLPIEAPYPTHRPLRDLGGRWERGEKSLRTLPVLNVYHRVRGGWPPDAVVRTLLGLDANVNAIDDIWDTGSLTTDDKVDLTCVAAFSSTFAVRSIPDEHRHAVLDAYEGYLSFLFQVPEVERQLLARFEASDDEAERAAVARESYRYRARAITLFAEIPAIVLDVDPDRAERIVADLQQLRARQLVFKDLADVERDLRDDDPTPLLELLRGGADTARIEAFVSRLADSFAFSEAGMAEYGDVLCALEGRPEDLRGAIDDQLAALEATAERGHEG